MSDKTIVFGSAALSIEDIVALAGGATATLNDDPAFRQRIDASHNFLHQLLQDQQVIYGVTTGYGDHCDVNIPPAQWQELPLHLSRYHNCGLGRIFDSRETRAIIAARLASLCHGYSGVRFRLIEYLQAFLQHDVLPLIPAEGSVGASGDLTPLSYICMALIGERDVRYQGQSQAAAAVLQELQLDPLTLQPKEALAVMNGTAVMTGLACLAFDQATYLARLCARISSLSSLALLGNSRHFDPRLFAAKPHPGQAAVAAWIASDLGDAAHTRQRVQDRYSLRCAPHIIGVLTDSLPWLRQFIETELNSACDNPLIDADEQCIYHGGHFYGGHIAMAMDSMKNAVANLADLLDRQCAHLVDPKMNNGLPSNLSAADSERLPLNHGLKGVQISCSAWAAEALKLSMPASVFSRSTESHNQDKVSMGTIAARDCLRILTLTRQCAAATLFAAQQAVALRLRRGELQHEALQTAVSEMHDAFMQDYPLLIEDRPLDKDLQSLVDSIAGQDWSLYQDE